MYHVIYRDCDKPITYYWCTMLVINLLHTVGVSCLW